MGYQSFVLVTICCCILLAVSVLSQANGTTPNDDTNKPPSNDTISAVVKELLNSLGLGSEKLAKTVVDALSKDKPALLQLDRVMNEAALGRL